MQRPSSSYCSHSYACATSDAEARFYLDKTTPTASGNDHISPTHERTKTEKLETITNQANYHQSASYASASTATTGTADSDTITTTTDTTSTLLKRHCDGYAVDTRNGPNLGPRGYDATRHKTSCHGLDRIIREALAVPRVPLPHMSKPLPNGRHPLPSGHSCPGIVTDKEDNEDKGKMAGVKLTAKYERDGAGGQVGGRKDCS